MSVLSYDTLGETWVRLVEHTLGAPDLPGDDVREVLGVHVTFPVPSGPDPLIERLGDPRMVAQMHQVFFSDIPNATGHSYASFMRGPGGAKDLSDIIALLRANPLTKRAVVTLTGPPHGKVPCINVIQFMVREGQVHGMYFARGQDVYAKFYADALCIAAMVRCVAAGLEVPAGQVTGFIASSHIYLKDLAAIEDFLGRSRAMLDAPTLKGAV